MANCKPFYCYFGNRFGMLGLASPIHPIKCLKLNVHRMFRACKCAAQNTTTTVKVHEYESEIDSTAKKKNKKDFEKPKKLN